MASRARRPAECCVSCWWLDQQCVLATHEFRLIADEMECDAWFPVCDEHAHDVQKRSLDPSWFGETATLRVLSPVT